MFSGRASRAEYWTFALINLVISVLLLAVDTAINSRVPDVLYGLATIVPSLAVGCRRLHDTDRTGWWQLIALVPVLGWLALIVLMALEGTHGPNKYGGDPKSHAVGAAASYPA
ncbi:inner membrane protein YhaI [Streptomyces sulfonofaciens]|uniref:Inner membrane protein YhaI n=1 Tax=Streptomyces sulfonofaciens TaxID=68272 RepID=A0A919G318_9ACTN|nr:inner membrane protein YhaI [Streptomyces sulfonofaciens]